MRRLRLMMMAAGGLLLAGAVIYAAYPGLDNRETREKARLVQAARAPEAAQPVQTEAKLPTGAGQEQAKPAFAPLRVQAVADAQGFGLALTPAAGLRVLKTLSMSEGLVHVVARDGEEESGGGERLEAVVVKPDLAAGESHVLYEVPQQMQSAAAVSAIDGDHLVFVRPAVQDGTMTYDLAKFDPADGRVDVVAERFWTQPLQDGQEPDFLLGMHVSSRIDGGTGAKVLLTSFKGRTWLIDWSSGLVQASPDASYPAYGDPGSSPIRELVYPSPDLSRMVYQQQAGRRFRVLDPSGGEAAGEFEFGEGTALRNPGISWNADSTIFYQEFGDASRTVAARSDAGLPLYAQSVRFYDRNGKPVRTFTLPGPSDARMNVYGWASDHEVWLETFRVRVPKQDAEPEKRDVAYKRFNIQTGTLTDYRTAVSPEEIALPEIVQPNELTAVFARDAFLLADKKSRAVWPSPHPASAAVSEQALYMHVPSDEGDALYRWTKEEPAWRWLDGRAVASDERAVGGWAWRLEEPTVHEDRWLVYVERDPSNGEAAIRYAKAAQPWKLTAGGLPILPPSISNAPELNEWWKRDGYYKPAEKTTGARVQGDSRYGTIKLVPLAGELTDIQEDGLQYYGDYAVTFKARTGVANKLPVIRGLRLEKEQAVAKMERISFDGWDLLLFRPQQYRFNKGLTHSPRYLRAYAATRDGEAFPLTFRYAESARGVGERSLAELPLDDNQPVRREGDRVVMLADVDKLELTLQPNLAARELVVMGAADRRRENEQLRGLAERYTELIEQALGLDEGLNLPEGRLEANKLVALFSEEAWNNPGFQQLKRDFDRQRRDGHPSRAFSWPPIDIVSVSPDTVRFTMTLNLFYAIGHAAHLEASLKLAEGAWKIHDFGTLQSQKGEGVPGYDGLVIEDPLRTD